MKLNEKLRRLRKGKGFSQKKVAELLDSHVNDISRYERGVQAPSTLTMKRLARIFNVSVDFLLSGNADPSAASHYNDQQLERYVEKLLLLPHADKMLIFSMIDALVIKHRVESQES
jgi:transcriptional regulator with XRE-family HTH domain